MGEGGSEPGGTLTSVFLPVSLSSEAVRASLSITALPESQCRGGVDLGWDLAQPFAILVVPLSTDN